MKKNKTLLICFLIVSFLPRLIAQEASINQDVENNEELSTGDNVDEGDSRDSFEFSGDQTSVNLKEGREYTLLRGNAAIKTQSITLSADEIELYGEDFRFVRSIGDVLFIDEENEIQLESRELFFDRVTEEAIASGGVFLDDKKNNLVARAQSIEILDQSNRVVFKIGVRVVQDDLFVRSELVVYQRESEKLRLEGYPSVTWGEDKYQAQTMNINLETEEVELIGRVSGAIVTNDE